MVVEDDQDTRWSTAYILATAGYEVSTAQDGLSALQRIESDPPDVILLDLGLPRLDGLEVLRRVRALELWRRPLLVVVSGYGSPEDMEQTRVAGADAHIVKPAEPEQLLNLLTRFSDLLSPSPAAPCAC